MKKGQIYEGYVDRYTFPNKGYVNVEDRTICVKGALKGQKVRFSIKRLKKGAGEGRLLEVLEKSSLENVEPLCPHYGQCGGCAYQTLSYKNQLRLKEEQVKTILEHAILTVDNFVENVDNSDKSENECLNCDNSSEELYADKILDNNIDIENIKRSKELSHDRMSTIWEGIKASPVTTAYRNKMEYSFGDECKDGPLALGMHKKGGFHDIVTVDHCRIVDDDYNTIIHTVLDFYDEKKVAFYKKMQHVGVLRHLVVRRSASNGEILVNLVTTTRDDLKVEVVEEGMKTLNNGYGILTVPDDEAVNGVINETRNSMETLDDVQNELSKKLYLTELQESLLALDLHGTIAGILHTWNDSLSDAVVPQRVVTLYGRDYIYEEILGLKFKISPFSFFQTNTRSAEVLYETARSYVMGMNTMYGHSNHKLSEDMEDVNGSVSQNSTEVDFFKDKVIFDLYSGTGTIAQMLAPVAKKVVGIEIVDEAVEAARENAALNGLSNCEFIAGDVLKVLDAVEEKPDIIVLDPPRDGCNPKALDKIINYNVPEMVYISCKPTSLARDLVTLQARGYRVVKACAVDQFPGTLHVECVTMLQRRDM